MITIVIEHNDLGDRYLSREYNSRKQLPYRGKKIPKEWYDSDGYGYCYNYHLHSLVKYRPRNGVQFVSAFDYDAVDLFTNVLR